MLNGKRMLNVDPSAQLKWLLDMSSVSGEDQSADAFRDRAVNRQLKLGNVHHVHSRLVSRAEEASPLPMASHIGEVKW